MLGSGLISLLSVVVAAQIPLTAPQQSAIDSFITARQPEGFGPGGVMSAAAADLTDDGLPDIAAVYGYQIGNARDRTGTHYVVVLVDGTSGFRIVGPAVIGAKGYRIVQTMEIKNGVIHLRGLQYLVGDPQCCPAGEFEMELAIRDGGLRETRGSWFRPGS